MKLNMLKYTPAVGSISFKIRGKHYISVAFLILYYLSRSHNLIIRYITEKGGAF